MTENLSDLKFRSVSEARLAQDILAQEGRWDAQQMCFLTKEKQLQELTKQFQELQSTVRYMPALAYVTQSADVNFVYPKCPRQLMKHSNTNNSQLSMEDPTRSNIEYRRRIAERNKILREKDLEEGNPSVVFGARERTEFMTNLEAEFRGLSTREAPTASAAPLHAGLKKAAPVDVQQSSSSLQRSQLPRIGVKSHSSLLLQLKKARHEALQHQREHSTVKTILELDASAALKNAITRMFADPKNADAISQEEYLRREREYNDERNRQANYQNEILREEREAMELELAHFK